METAESMKSYKLDSFDIYLDIDGVLKCVAAPSVDVEALLWYCLTYHPNSTYWLTTHCRGGVNNAPRALSGILPDDLYNEVCIKFKPCDFGAMKTDGINFARPFVWLDDNLFKSELAVLEEKGAADNAFWVDSRDDECLAAALEFIEAREIRQD